MANCSCGGTRLIYACSGAADVGEIADKVARTLRDENFARMSCLAGIGAELKGFIESAKGACGNITVDGCPVACAKKVLERAGVKPVSFILTELGYEKGKTPVTDKVIEEIKEKIKSLQKESR